MLNRVSHFKHEQLFHIKNLNTHTHTHTPLVKLEPTTFKFGGLNGSTRYHWAEGVLLGLCTILKPTGFGTNHKGMGCNKYLGANHINFNLISPLKMGCNIKPVGLDCAPLLRLIYISTS